MLQNMGLDLGRNHIMILHCLFTRSVDHLLSFWKCTRMRRLIRHNHFNKKELYRLGFSTLWEKKVLSLSLWIQKWFEKSSKIRLKKEQILRSLVKQFVLPQATQEWQLPSLATSRPLSNTSQAIKHFPVLDIYFQPLEKQADSKAEKHRSRVFSRA